MRYVTGLLQDLAMACDRMTFDELLWAAALVTLVVTVILMLAGHKPL